VRVEWIIQPQSNQRGIETPIHPRRKALLNSPQSNQRGIETKEVIAHERFDFFASIEPAWD